MASQPNMYCHDIVECHGQYTHEYPTDENAFFDCVADQLSNHPIMLEDGTSVMPYVVRRVTYNYKCDHAEELQVIKLMIK